MIPGFGGQYTPIVCREEFATRRDSRNTSTAFEESTCLQERSRRGENATTRFRCGLVGGAGLESATSCV